MRARRVVVIGGGVSGLSLAHALVERSERCEERKSTTGEGAGEGRPSAGPSAGPSAVPSAGPIAWLDVEVLEGSERVGGNVQTVRREGFLLDLGADSWVSAKPHATALARRLGLGDRLIETTPANRRVYVADARGGLVPLPEGLTLGIPTRIAPLLRTPLLSWRGKARALLDLVEPAGFMRRNGAGGDEAVGDFIARRLGREVLDRLAGPLLGGLFTGDVGALSLHATFPQLAALEGRGGLIRGARAMSRAMPQAPTASNRGPGEPPPGAFTSLHGGVGELIDALAARLGHRIRTRTLVKSIARLPDGDARGRFALERVDGETTFADHVAVAGPAHVAAGLLRVIDPVTSERLASIPHGSSAVVFLAFRRVEVPRALDATGYLVPTALGRAALASTWVSSKWPGRAPDDDALLRVFFGARHVDLDDDRLIEMACDELRTTLGVAALPHLRHVARFRRGSPQPRVGHPAMFAEIEARLASIGGVHVTGSAYEGVGIADCVRRSERVADAILRSLSR